MHFDRLKKREFITLLGGVAAAWPLATRAQQAGIPLVGFLQRSAPIRADFAHFWDGLAALEYKAGRNDFITLLGGSAAWPVAVRAQQRALPVIGFSARFPTRRLHTRMLRSAEA